MRRWAWVVCVMLAVGAAGRPAAAETGAVVGSPSRSCLVWTQGGVVECFGSDKELDVRSAELAAARSARAGSCSSSLDVWADAAFLGTHLRFWDEGVWINLADYGFDDQLSSYYGGACSFHLAESAWGGGVWYPGSTGPYGSSSSVGAAWDDRVSSVFID